MFKLLSSFVVCLFLNMMIFQLPVYAMEQNTSEYFAHFHEKAVNGDAEAQYYMGLSYDLGDTVKHDYIKARQWYEKAANQGYANAQYDLGTMYQFGRGVRQDFAKAGQWYEKAAAQGHTDAQYMLGTFYQFVRE